MIESSPSRIQRVNWNVNAGLAAFERQAVLQYLVLAGIVVFAAVMRFYKLGQWGLWIDEALEINYAQAELRNFPNVSRLSLPLIGLALQNLGISEWSARLVPNLVGILSLPVLFFPFKKLFGPAVALTAVLFLALSPWHLHWSQNARFYTFLLLFYTLGQLAFFFWLETNRWGYLALSVFFLILAALERMVAAFIAPVVLAYLGALLFLPFGRPEGFKLKNFLILGVPPLLFALYIVLFTSLLGDFDTMIVGHEHSPLRVGLSIVYDVGLPLFLAALAGGAYLLTQRSRAGLYLLIGALVPSLALVVIAPFTQAFSRYVFMTLPSFALLAAVACKELFVQSQKGARLLALGLVVILLADAASQSVLYYAYQNGNRENFKDAFALVRQEWQPGDQVVSTRPEVGAFYLTEPIADSQKVDLQDVAAGGQRTWFVLDNRTYISPELQGWLYQNAGLRGIADVNLPGKTIMMRVYLYQPAGTTP